MQYKTFVMLEKKLTDHFKKKYFLGGRSAVRERVCEHTNVLPQPELPAHRTLRTQPQGRAVQKLI